MAASVIGVPGRAAPGGFSLARADAMIEDLRRDLRRMAGMIIGESSLFDEVMDYRS